MSEFDPTAWSLGVHSTLAGLSLAGYYKLGDRTAVYSKIAGELEGLKATLRARIAGLLEDYLKDVFSRTPGDPHLSSAQSNRSELYVPVRYAEQPTMPLGTDAYRQALRDFMLVDGAELLSAHWGLDRACRRWCDAARWLSWVLLVALAWEVLCAAVLGILGKLCAVVLPAWMPSWSFLPTTLLAVSFFACLAVMLWSHDEIMRNRRTYGDL